MKKRIILIQFLILLVFPGQVLAIQPEAVFLNSLLFQGDTLVANVKSDSIPVSAAFDTRDLSVFKYGDTYKIVGAIQAAEKTGYHDFSIKFADNTSYSKRLYIRARKFPLVDLGIPEKLGVTAGELVQNLATEKANINSIITLKANEAFFTKSFGLPLANNKRIVAPYGEIRKTGDQSIRHLGIDFGAPKGSFVAAINDGVVREAENDPTYGNTVIIDHGAGIFSLYMHLDTIKANVGQSVKYGQIIGTVGETGYATGPHLHLSIKIGMVSIDPVKFVNIFR
ncbi:MAG: M23 family metallopeptidase [Minisyncoccia bacterium]